MKNVLIGLFSLLICSYVKGQNISYKNVIQDQSYKVLDIDINKDGIKDKVAYNTAGNDLLFYVKKKDDYINVFHGDNYNMDGVYFTNQIKGYDEGSHVLYIQNIFNGSGGQTIEYFLSYINQQWILEESFTTSSNYLETKICKNFDKKESCITIKKEGDFIRDIAEAVQTKKNSEFYTKEYIFCLLNKFPLTIKNLTQYNNLAFQLQETERNNEAVYLLNEIIYKFPTRVVAYLNLADNYWMIGNQKLAKENYQKYVDLMKSQKKDRKKIPQYVWTRIK